MDVISILDLILRWLVPFALGGVVAWVSKTHKEQQKVNQAMRDGVRSLLYDRIVQGYIHYHDDLGWMPIDAKESMQEVYNSYRNLGGNGLGEQMYDRMKALPTKKEKDND